MDEQIRGLFSFLETNDLAVSGIVIVAFGALLASLRNLPVRIGLWLFHRFTTTVTVYNTDIAFGWVTAWVQGQVKAPRVWALQLVQVRQGENQIDMEPQLSPGVGHHLTFYRRRPVWIQRQRKDGIDLGGGGTLFSGLREWYEIVLVGRDPSVIRSLVNDLKEAVSHSSDRLLVYSPSWSTWDLASRPPKRPATTLWLPKGMWDAVREDVRWFLSHEQWYLAHGVPYRRGCLLVGPPGTGKSTMVGVVASEFGLPVYVLRASGTDTNDRSLVMLLSRMLTPAVLLIEDVDCLFDPDRQTGDKDQHITFSGLSNALDGVQSTSGYLLFMTTNHPEKLDPALVRPGRCDLRYDFGPATAEQVYAAYKHLTGTDGDDARLFAESCAERKMTMADVQRDLLARAAKPSDVNTHGPGRTRPNT